MAFKFPFTVMFLGVMVLANYLAGTLTGELPHNMLTTWGINHTAIVHGQLYRLFTGTFLSHDFGMFVRQMAFAATVIGYVEWTYGTPMTAGLFFGLDVVGTIILLGLLAWLKPVLPLTNTYDVGMSIGGFALVGLSIAGWRWRWVLCGVILVAIAVKYAISPDVLADLGHVLALFLGLTMGLILPYIWSSQPKEADHGR